MWGQRIASLNYLSLCFLSCFPLLGMKLTVIAIIVFSALSVLNALLNKKESGNFGEWKKLLIFLLPFFLIFIRTGLVDKSDESLFYLEVSLSLLAFPIAFFLTNTVSQPERRSLPVWLFAAATLLMVLYGQVVVGFNIAQVFGHGKTWESYSQMFNDASFPYQIRTVFEQTVSVHPTHASIFLGISILIIIETLFVYFEKLSKSKFSLLIIALCLALVMLAVLASRTPFMATMLAALLLSFFHFTRKIYIVYVLGSMIVLSILLAVLVPSFSERFREISMSNVQLPTQDHENSFNLRTGIYKCSMNTISQNWLWGIGPGNVQQSLNTCYNDISKEVYDEKNYNTHNQFLDYWAGLGIAGPVSLLLVFGCFVWTNLKKKNHLAVALAVLFFISMLTENLLTRQNGLVPFGFFMGLFFFNNAKTTSRLKHL